MLGSTNLKSISTKFYLLFPLDVDFRTTIEFLFRNVYGLSKNVTILSVFKLALKSAFILHCLSETEVGGFNSIENNSKAVHSLRYFKQNVLLMR